MNKKEVTYDAGGDEFVDEDVDSALLALRKVGGAEGGQRVLRRTHHQVREAVARHVGHANAGAEVLAHLLAFQLVKHPQLVLLGVRHRVQKNLKNHKYKIPVLKVKNKPGRYFFLNKC